MDSRLLEKLKLAGGVVARQHQKIEARADTIIAREQEIERKTDEAFAPHEALLNAAEKGLDDLEHQLAAVSNDPLQTGAATVRNGKDTADTITINSSDTRTLDRQGRAILQG